MALESGIYLGGEDVLSERAFGHDDRVYHEREGRIKTLIARICGLKDGCGQDARGPRPNHREEGKAARQIFWSIR